jgi:hypothetical protein
LYPGQDQNFAIVSNAFLRDGGGRRTRTFEVIRRLIYSFFLAHLSSS